MSDVLSPAEVGRLFGVGPKTVSEWARTGRLPSFRTPGGHRRFRRADIEVVVDEARWPIEASLP